jgi:hypothetical protein
VGAGAFLRLLAEAELRRFAAHRRDSGMDGEVALRVEVVPPLGRCVG